MSPVLVVLGSQELHERRSRAAAAVRYLDAHPGVDTVVFSGHNGEAEQMLAFAQGFGLREGVQTLLEQESSHTYDNAVKTRELLRQHGLHDRILVVLTCRYHMPRALRTFRTQFTFVDQAVGGRWTLDDVSRFIRNELPRMVEHIHFVKQRQDRSPVFAPVRTVEHLRIWKRHTDNNPCRTTYANP